MSVARPVLSGNAGARSLRWRGGGETVALCGGSQDPAQPGRSPWVGRQTMSLFLSLSGHYSCQGEADGSWGEQRLASGQTLNRTPAGCQVGRGSEWPKAGTVQQGPAWGEGGSS